MHKILINQRVVDILTLPNKLIMKIMGLKSSKYIIFIWPLYKFVEL